MPSLTPRHRKHKTNQNENQQNPLPKLIHSGLTFFKTTTCVVRWLRCSVFMFAPRRVRRNYRKCKNSATRSRYWASPMIRSPNKNFMNRCARLASISVVILIRTDTTLDHSQKAEKVWRFVLIENLLLLVLCDDCVVLIYFCWEQVPPKIVKSH